MLDFIGSQYANELELTASRFAQFRDQRNTAATQRATGVSNVASEASYWCNRRETSDIQARPYSEQRGTRTHMRSIIVYHYVYVRSYKRSLALAVQCETMHGAMPASSACI